MNIREKVKYLAEKLEEKTGVLADPEATAEEKEAARKEVEGLLAQKKELVDLTEIEKERKEILSFADQLDDDERRRDETKKFDRWGHFLKAAHMHTRGISTDDRLEWFDDERGKAISAKDMAEGVGASGGFLVPPEFRAELYSVMGERSFIRPRSTVIPMTRREIDIPVLDQTSTTSGVPHWFGGMQFYWAEEAAQKTSTDPEFRKVRLTANKLIGYTRASDELLDDAAISLEAFLSGPQGFAGGAVWMEEYAFLNGTGAGQPMGVINSGCTITHARAADGEVGYDDVVGMLQSFLPSGNGVWIISQSAMSEIVTMAGPADNPSYVWQPNARDGVPGSLLGFPVVWTEKVPRVGSAGDVILADFSYYLIGDRQATTVESTQYDRWRYDQTSWRMVHRVDGQPWLSAPLTYQDGSTEVSPFVILGEKSS